jgi:hypothetical protein
LYIGAGIAMYEESPMFTVPVGAEVRPFSRQPNVGCRFELNFAAIENPPRLVPSFTIVYRFGK